MKSLTEIRALKNKIVEIGNQYGATNFRVFGSVARDEADSKSDIDFLISLEDGRSAFELGGLLIDLQDLLGCKVDIVTDRSLKSSIANYVMKDIKSL